MAITTTSNLTGLVQTAYDTAVDFAFSAHLRFAQLAETKKWSLIEAPVPGDTIRFTIFGDELQSGVIKNDYTPRIKVSDLKKMHSLYHPRERKSIK